ncbi:10162_t:CDS:2, partial [Gigaspora margarita]
AITSLEENRLNEIVDTHNLVVKIIKKVRKIGISFGSQIKELEKICIADLETRELKEAFKQRKRNIFVLKLELNSIVTD